MTLTPAEKRYLLFIINNDIETMEQYPEDNKKELTTARILRARLQEL